MNGILGWMLVENQGIVAQASWKEP